MHDIYILGSGAMGSLWASYFYPQHSLHFIQRHTNNNLYSFDVLPYAKQVTGQSILAQDICNPIQYLVIATKAYDAFEAIDSVKPHLNDKSQVILLQNGLGSQQRISEAFPDIKLYACSSTEGAYKKDTHTLMHAGIGVNSIGALNGHVQKDELKQWLPDTHFEWHDDIQQVMWRKFMINCAINPLTVLYNCQNGKLVENDDYLSHMQRICEEIDKITEKLNYSLDNAFKLAQNVCKSTANNFSSMLQDHRKQQPTEIQFMTGYLLQQAEALGLSCPENQALYQKLTCA